MTYMTRHFRKETQKMVLIVSTVKKKAQSISEIFYYMGVLSYAATPYEATSEISGVYRAVLVLDSDELPDTDSFIKKMRAYNSSIPIFSMTDLNGVDRYDGIFDKEFDNDIYSSTLIAEIVSHQNARKLPLTAHYRLAGIDASCDKTYVTVFDKSVTFTKTETMLLRYLIASYPAPQSAKSIIKYAFKPSKKPETASIRTHVSIMNKKFREVRGRNLFVNIPNQGYTVSTPEILSDLAKIV